MQSCIVYTCVFVFSVHIHACTHLHTHSHKHTQDSSPDHVIPGTITALPFRIYFTDYGFPMMEYKILYLKGVSEDPNVCLYLAITLVIFSFLCWNFVCSIGPLITCIQKDLTRNGVLRPGTWVAYGAGEQPEPRGHCCLTLLSGLIATATLWMGHCLPHFPRAENGI